MRWGLARGLMMELKGWHGCPCNVGERADECCRHLEESEQGECFGAEDEGC
jgi:hypothetical protein